MGALLAKWPFQRGESSKIKSDTAVTDAVAFVTNATAPPSSTAGPALLT